MSEPLDGTALHRLAERLYPICRSITGEGFRESLRILEEYIPITVSAVPSGTPVFDWTVPNEWNIRDAYVEDAGGNRVVDFRAHNLHVVQYSTPVRQRMTLEALRPHLHSRPDRPDWIPYRTSYYKETWGFCLRHRDLDRLPEGEYEVCIDATLAPGQLNYGECVVPGRTDEEVLISVHSCHPSLCNDNLSGMTVAVELARGLLAGDAPRYRYRFLFIPGTIGSITWLARNEAAARKIEHGLVLTCVGDAGHSTYKRSRRGAATIDRAAVNVLEHSGAPFEVLDFVPYGYDERQYCSPGFDLAVGSLMRTPNGQFPEYHTSADNLEFIRPESLEDTIDKTRRIFEILEHDRLVRSRNPKCEPQLGKRGLYKGVAGGGTELPGYELALLWVMNLADGRHTLLNMAERARMPFGTIRRAADDLERNGLVTSQDPEGSPS